MGQALEDAITDHRAGRLLEAERKYRKALDAEPQNLEVLFHYGYLLRHMGRAKQARDLFRRALRIAPREAVFHAALGETEQVLGKPERAIKSFEKALACNPDDVASLINLGLCHQERGRLEDACRLLRRAVDARPDFTPALVNLGIALHLSGEKRNDLGQVDEAVACFQRAIEIHPADASAHANLGVACLHQQHFEEAVAACRQALKIAPGLLMAQNALAHSLAYLGRLDEATEVFEMTAASHPENAQPLIELGTAYWRRKRFAAAITAYERAAVLMPRNLHVFLALGAMCNAAGQFQRAVEVFDRALQLSERKFTAHRGRVLALLRLGRLDEAREACGRALEINPRDTSCRFAHAALSQQKVAAAPADYIVEMFDQFAETFDDELRGELDYRSPEQLHEAVLAVMGGAPSGWTIVDIGCGTGLCGLLFRDMAARLIGSDLSPRMIEKARQRGAYDELRVEPLDDTLSQATREFDLVVAADVFVYVGDLDPVFGACATALKPGGLFAFSTEHGQGDDFTINEAMRFTHAPAYVGELAARHGFERVHEASAVIRKEAGVPVNGGIYVFQKP